MAGDYDPFELNTYHCAGERPWQDRNHGVPLRIGEGFLDASSDNRRFRVVDIWYSTDSHGVFDVGRHVFLEDLTGSEEDLLATLAPDYFAD
jgi:hypothetical protein